MYGSALPVQPSFKYLGLTLHADLSLKKVVKVRVDKAERALGALVPFLTTRLIPVPVKVTVIKSLLYSVIRYGGELLGMRADLATPMQRILSRALRLALGARPASTLLPWVSMHDELNVPPVQATWAADKLRALTKYPNLSTLIADL